MTYPMPDPHPHPTGPHGPRQQTGTATYGAQRRCQYCGERAEVFDIDGGWCSPQCQTYDRQSETTWWRKAVAR